MSLVLHGTPNLLELRAALADASPDIVAQWEALTGSPWNLDDVTAQLYRAPGPSWVAMDGATVIAAGGFIPVRPGVYHDWLAPTPAAFTAPYWRSVTKICRRVMDSMLDGDAHRLEAHTLASREKAVDWLSVLGYRREGILRAYGANGEDFVAYSRVKE